MKNIIKIIFGLLFLIIAAIFLVPILYKEKIINYIKEDINKGINAKVDFKDVDLTLFRSFPNFNLELNKLTVDGIGAFEKVRLFDVQGVNLTMDIKSVIGGKQIEISKIIVDGAKINILVLKDGKANYNITKPSDSQTEASKFNIDLKKYVLNNADIIYDDLSLNFKTVIKNLNHEGAAKLSDNIYQLKTKSRIDTLTIKYAGINYLNKVKTDIETDFDISGDFNKYTLKNTKAKINELPLTAEGFLELNENEIVMDIRYKTDNANITQLLSLIPKEYMPDLNGAKTSGTAQVSGFVKGKNTENVLPGFKLLIDVKDATIQYPDLPEKVKNINLFTDVDFKGGNDLNTMTIDLPRVNFDIAGSKVSGKLNVKQPMSDPFISAAFSSKLDFEKVKQAVKFEQVKDLTGFLDADLEFSGTVSAMNNQQVDKINAKGYFNLSNFKIKTDSFKEIVEIPQAKFNLTPAELQIEKLNTFIGKNDITMVGSVKNYLAYAMGKNEVLKGNFSANSKYLNLNDFMTESSTDTQTKKGEDFGIIKVPQNLDIIMNLDAQKLIFQNLNITNAKGKLLIANQEIKLSEVSMNMMGGTVNMGGTYNTSGEKARTNLNLGLEQFGIKESVSNFEIFNAYAPILNNLTGKFISDLNLNVDLNNDMQPILSSVNANGVFKTDEVNASGIEILRKVSDVLKIGELKNPKFDNLKASFTIKDGILSVKPNQFTLNGMQAGISGTFNLEKQLNFELTLDIPREKLGNNFNSVINQLAGVAGKLNLANDIGQIVKAKFIITGSALKPQIKPVLMGSGGQTLTETVTQIVETKVEEVKNDALEKAQLEADKIISTAKSQKEKLMIEAEKLALETKNKAKLAGDELIKKAGDNPLKNLAAQTAANKVVKEGDKKALQITSAANKKGDELIQKAQTEAANLIQKANETGK